MDYLSRQQFCCENLEGWLSGLGCGHRLTARRHPQPSEVTENPARYLKSDIASITATTFAEIDEGVHTHWMRNRNAAHTTTEQSACKPLKQRVLATNMLCLKSIEVLYRDNKLRPSSGIVVNNIDTRMCQTLDLADGYVHHGNADRIVYNSRDTR
ncbi:hypothetical protein P879_07868 [Paragonimus westermani]|uniref:Uncharacterized protein n=1 Tax=Paragonimus westermani TaxID=34504 RepID=A0A8T0DKK9_9TREM|nr:hypothetical protein P879_07868 [Paragonimus westermani]